MPFRPFLRWLLLVACTTVGLLASRGALAAAPMCDERGASVVAPTPHLPAADERLEAVPPLECGGLDWARLGEPSGPGAHGAPHAVAQEPDPLLATRVTLPLSVPVAPLTRDTEVGCAARSGHEPDVFHPPRS